MKTGFINSAALEPNRHKTHICYTPKKRKSRNYSTHQDWYLPLVFIQVRFLTRAKPHITYRNIQAARESNRSLTKSATIPHHKHKNINRVVIT